MDQILTSRPTYTPVFGNREISRNMNLSQCRESYAKSCLCDRPTCKWGGPSVYDIADLVHVLGYGPRGTLALNIVSSLGNSTPCFLLERTGF